MAKTLLATDPKTNNRNSEQRDDTIRPEPRWLVWLDRFDRPMAGRRRAVAAVSVVAAMVSGSLVDWLRSSAAPVGRVVATNLLLLVLWAIAFAWLGSERDARAGTEGRGLFRRIEALWLGLVEDVASLPRREPTQRWGTVGSYGVGLGCVLLLTDGLAALGNVLFGSNTSQQWQQQYLTWVGMACVALGAWPWFRSGLRGSNFSDQVGLTRSKIRELPAILELETLPGRALDPGDFLSQTLVALAQWSKRKIRQYPDEFAYREALARHFRQYLGHGACRRERWLGSKRDEGVADLVLGRLVAVKICRGLDQASGERIVRELGQFAQSWRGRPKLLVIFEVERRELLTNVAMPALQSLHETAELVIVRM